MNKKQLTVEWSKKILAFILDIIIAYPLILILEFVTLILLSSFVVKEYLVLVERVLDIPFLIIYFFYIPKLIGNTFGRKILRIQDKLNLFWTWSFLRHLDNFPKKHLKKDVILKVTPKNSRWTCPSCNGANLEAHDVCSECGQEVEKVNE